MIHHWKRQLAEGAADVFERGRKRSEPAVDDETVRDLQAKIGELAVANDFLSRKLEPWAGTAMVEREHPALPVTAQCRLLSIPRSTFYHSRRGETDDNLALMRGIDEQFLQTPFYGVRQMT